MATARHVLRLGFVLAAAAGALHAVDCSPAAVLCVPEETTLAAAFTGVPDGGTIDVAPGVYPSPADNLGFRLGANVNRSFTVRARTSGAVTLDGQSARLIVVLESLGAGRWVTFEGLRFVNGRTTAPGRAGGVTLRGARATFVDCDFVGHRGASGSNGGAALGLYGTSKALVTGGLFDGNRSLEGGAAIFAQRGLGAGNDQPNDVFVHSTVFRDNCETGPGLLDCTSGNGAGGALLVRNSSASISDSLFEDNVAGWVGGAIYAFGDFACNSPFCPVVGTQVLVVRTRFVGNRADGTNAPSQLTQAGAIHVEDCARVRLYHSVFEDNLADWAGAVQSFRGAIEIYDSVFRGNRATATGANLAFAGAVSANSGDGVGCPSQQTRDYPAASLRVERSLFQGSSAAPQDAQVGGCLIAAGDGVNVGSGACLASQTNRCAQVAISDTAFFDCTVARGSTPVFVYGGGFVLERAFATMTNVLVARNRAVGNGGGVCARGGGGAVRSDTALTMNDVLFSGNTADCLENDLQVINTSPPAQTNVRFYTGTSSSPPDGMLLDLPGERAADTLLTDGVTWLAAGWSGGSALLDGIPLGTNPRNLVGASGAGNHNLVVDGGAASDAANHPNAALPHTTLAAASACPGGGATTLSWTTPAGAFLAAFVDQNVAGATAGGSAPVTTAGTVTYRRLALTAQGGDLASATVFVGVCGLFADGFESGDTSAWSSTTP